MKLRIHLLLPLLSLSLLLAVPAHGETAEDFFHGGAMFFLSNNIPSAKEVVTNGLQRFPEDQKLKKLWELLNQQQQSQSQQQQQEQKDEQKQEEKKDEKKQQQEQRQDQKQKESQDNQKPQEQKEMQAHAMTPEEAKQLLDSQKGEEQILQFRPPDQKNRPKSLKDW